MNIIFFGHTFRQVTVQIENHGIEESVNKKLFKLTNHYTTFNFSNKLQNTISDKL